MSECQLWSGRVDAYGRPIAVKGRTFRPQHRVFEVAYGYAPKRIKLTCGNSTCMNVEHMQDSEKVTAEEKLKKFLVSLEKKIAELPEGSIERVVLEERRVETMSNLTKVQET